MTTDFSVRQLLACLNISVFNPVMDPALKKVCQIETKQEAENENAFYTTMPLAGMALAAFLCFYGLRAHPFSAGLLLFSVCGLALRKAVSDRMRFFLKTYFVSGLLLLTEALFLFSPAVMTFCLFVFFARSLFFPEDRWQRIILSALFFSSVCFLYRDSLFIAAGCFSLLGTAGLLFPLKNVYGREAGIVFTVLPVLLILAGNALSMSGEIPPARQEGVLLTVFMAELLILLLALWRDMEINEIFLFFVGSVVLSVCGVFLSVGIQGSLVLFLIAFFINSPALGKMAAFLFTCFWVLFFLSMTVSLFSVAIVCAVSGIVFEWGCRRLRRFAAKEK